MDSAVQEKDSESKKSHNFKALENDLDKGNIIPAGKSFEFNLTNLVRGILGIFVILLIAFLLSENRRTISWKVIGIGLLLQVLLAIGILQVPFIKTFFEYGGKAFVKILDFTDAGSQFLFRAMDTQVIEQPLRTFAFTILPTIIFFSALTSVLFYFGIIQKIVWGLAWIMVKLLKLSGAESLSVAGNIFLGQTESPLMIKAYLEKMNRSEMLLVMSGGMATMAGGVLALYINFLGGNDPIQKLEFARHLLAASVMAAPGVVVISKILVPQDEGIEKEVKVSQERIGQNVLDSINNGTYEGLRLAVNVAAMLLVFLAFIAMANYIFSKFGQWLGLNEWAENISGGRYDKLSLQFMLGYIFSPIMWLLGVPAQDITLVGSLLGEKIIMTELVGYISLAELKGEGAFSDPKSIIMATYILCGFANFASVGIQIGGIGALAPGKKVLLAEFGMKSLLAGTLASLLSATIVGIILA
ncbi:MAG: NupC/NupG family nucleoside CNT transporter [Bacteroidota bacterium]